MDTCNSDINASSRVDFFANLPEKQRVILFQKGRTQSFPSKTIIFHQGYPAKHFFMVNQGRLKLTRLNEHGKEVIMRFVESGELTAAVTALQQQNYPVTAEATTETTLTIWDQKAMIRFMHDFPDITINLLSIALERLDDMQQRYLEICTEQADQRVARTLLRIMRRSGVKTPSGIKIDMPLSRQDIAEYSGTTLFTVSRILSQWEKKGWIQSGRELIVIIDPHSLVTFSESG